MIKDEEIEQQIPLEWRDTLELIVEDIKNRNLQTREVAGHRCIVDRGVDAEVYRNIESYGEELDSLSDEVWESSICRWMGDHWRALIDLNTISSGLSDLVLFLDVTEDKNSFVFHVLSVHVP